MGGRRGNSPPFLIMVKITVPGIQAHGSLLQASSASYNDTDHLIGFSKDMIMFLANQIMSKEMEVLKRTHPEVDIIKLQEMISSGDKEMNNLADTILYKYTRYTGRILHLLRIGIIGDLENVVSEYTRLNSMNITDEIL